MKCLNQNNLVYSKRLKTGCIPLRQLCWQRLESSQTGRRKGIIVKTEILTMLRNTQEYISGQSLCNHFGVSRTAIWKVINQLKEEGYKIEAVQNRGYRIVKVPDVLYESELKSRMTTAFMGQKVYYFDSIDSTNIYAKKIADAKPEGTLVVADTQLSGKGSRGRSWESLPGEGIWMTVILKPELVSNTIRFHCRLSGRMILSVTEKKSVEY